MTKNLNFFNTLSNKREKFVPINSNKIGMYVCGPTVYDFPHIGNARPLVVFDVLFRLLQSLYGKNKVTYVRNITDIDDKIIEAQPTDGLWDDGRTDVNQLGMSYTELEIAMKDTSNKNHKKYLDIRKRNLHKMNSIPVCKMKDD